MKISTFGKENSHTGVKGKRVQFKAVFFKNSYYIPASF
jgi:hypothetical protein